MFCKLMACDTEENPESVMDCLSLTVDEYEAETASVLIMASQVIVDDEEECFLWANSIDNVGCMNDDMGCDDAITYAESPETPGECYGFTNTCIPDGWSECSLGSYPECR